MLIDRRHRRKGGVVPLGGVKAKQGIVCALLRGPEAHYALGEDVSRRMYAPVMRSHRATVEQMAILEPVSRCFPKPFAPPA